MICTVIVIADLFFVLVLGVHDNVGNEIQEDIFEQFGCKIKLHPVMTLLENVEHISYGKKAFE